MTSNKRWLIPVMLLIMNTVNYLDRVNISVAGPDVAREFHLGPTAMGVVFSCFFYSYLPLLVLMGVLVDRLGARLVSTTSMIVWALGSALTGVVDSYAALIGARLLLGIGESASYPVGTRIVREWAPRTERGIFAAIFSAGASLGPAIGMLAAAALIAAFHWRLSFILLGALTLVWTLVWFLIYRSPERARWLGERERAWVLAQREPERIGSVHPMSLPRLLAQPTMWGLLLTQGCQVYSLYLFLTWLPTYLMTVRHIHLFEAGWLGMLPYLIATLGSIGFGILSDRMLRGRDPSTGARRVVVIVLMLLASCVLLIPFVHNLVAMEALVIGAVTFGQSANTLNYALTADLIHDRDSAGRVNSLLVLGGNGFGFLAPILTGLIIAKTHSYTPSFVLAGGLLLVGSAICWFMVRRPLQPVDKRLPAVATA
jgi:MFS family permease